MAADVAAISFILSGDAPKPLSLLGIARLVETGLPLAALDRVVRAVAPDDASFVARIVPKATLSAAAPPLPAPSPPRKATRSPALPRSGPWPCASGTMKPTRGRFCSAPPDAGGQAAPRCRRRQRPRRRRRSEHHRPRRLRRRRVSGSNRARWTSILPPTALATRAANTAL